jgi:phage repressor protein C with HTH and peptisase S24 domain
MHNAFMDTPLASRLRQARKAAGFDDATTAARRYGWVIPTYLAHENGSRGVNPERGALYARAFKVHPGWLLTGEGSRGSIVRIPVSGYVGAGGMIYPADETTGPGGIDEVELPPGEYGDFAAFKVRGDSNYPAYRNDEIIFVKKEGGPPLEYINRECVVRTADGRRMLKMLRLGSKKGHFTLHSFNAPPMIDEQVEWASPVEWTRKP